MSTLYVDTITEKTAGNGVQIADLVPAAGSVAQVVENSGATTFNSSASSWVNTPVTGTIKPQYSTSLIIGVATVAVWRSGVSAYFGVRAVNSGGNTSQVMARGDGFMDTGSISWDTTYPFSYTAGSTSAITTTFQVYPNGTVWFPNDASIFSSETNFQRWHIRLMEIAQ